MMKWGRKKSSSSSSSVSHVFPLLWRSMFKRMTDSTEPNSANAKPKEKRNSSFREERNEGPKSGDVLQSVWYDSDDELEVHFPSHHRLMPRAVKLEGEEKSQMLGNVIARRRKMRESPRHVEILQKGENESEKSKMLRRRALKDIKSRKTYQRIPKEKSTELPRGVDEAEENSTKSIARDLFELEPVRIIQTEKDFQKSAVFDLRKQRNSSFANSSLRKIQEDRKFETLKREQVSALSEEDFFISEWKNLKDMKINEIMMKSEEQRKSALISWESSRKRKNQSRKGVYTPRTTARIECKIRALEDLKKAKMRTKKATKEKAAKDASHGTIAFDSFAVVKNSWDPQEDFKTSMAEMITANGIRQPQELEELLACYLTLNCDEYHDLIIKVFRQVWFDLNRSIFDPTIKCEHCCTCNAKTLA